jgi:hypothetical protein
MKFREHHGSLEDSMKTVVTVNSWNSLRKIVMGIFPDLGYIEEITIEKYSYDKRIDWDTHSVNVKFSALKHKVIAGFTNGPIQ